LKIVRTLVTALAVLALTGTASVAGGAPDATARSGLTGDPAGIRLAAQVNRSYAHVPGVRIDVGGGVGGSSLSVRFTFVLRSGVAVAEHAMVDQGADGRSALVRTGNQGTFARDPGRSCWRFVPKTDPQALTDIGEPVLSDVGRVSRPRVSGDMFVLPIATHGLTMRAFVDRGTSQLRRLEAPGYLARFTTLRTKPVVPATKPRC
jgi:hypothetical protein